MKAIWCPACQCDVRRLLSAQMHKDHERIKAGKRDIRVALKRLHALANAMEQHAQEKADTTSSVQEIYRMWSNALFAEVEKYFPEGAS